MDKQLGAVIIIGLMLACAMSHPGNLLGQRKYALVVWLAILLLPIILLILSLEFGLFTLKHGYIWLIGLYVLLLAISLLSRRGFSLWAYLGAKFKDRQAPLRSALSDDQVMFLHQWRPVIVDGQADADSVLEMRVNRYWASWLEAVGGVLIASAYVPVILGLSLGSSLSLITLGIVTVASGIIWDYRARLHFNPAETAA